MPALLGEFLSIDFTEDDLWNAHACLHSLTIKPKADFYDAPTKKKMIKTKKKIFRFGKTNFGWVK